MSEEKISDIVDAAPHRLRDVRLLVNSCGLSVSDLGLVPTILVTIGEPVVAAAAVERYDRFGLLRSVAVSAERQGEGLGKRVVQLAENAAIQKGVTDLYLLTETAETFFPKLGYQKVDRQDIPEPVRGSSEFMGGRCATAVAFHRATSGSTAPQTSPSHLNSDL